jgi:glucosyl-dolichyl phosphate glucuronosyltransferase
MGAETSASVVVATYTVERWEQLVRCVDSMHEQTRAPLEIIVAVDHNDDLLERCRAKWPEGATGVPVRVISSAEPTAPASVRTSHRRTNSGRPHGGGGTRHAGARVASGTVICFIDDDAWADPTWLEFLLAPYDHLSTVAVGGRPIPEFESKRPSWFPESFDWIFGCDYDELPKTLAPTTRLIGANFSLRSDVFRQLGGFKTVDLEDLYICMQLAKVYPPEGILYEPKSVVHHFVPQWRTTWKYFCSRCYFVNRDKVRTFEVLGEAASLAPELAFVQSMMVRQTRNLSRRFLRGDLKSLPRLAAAYCGVVCAGVGHLVGSAQQIARRYQARHPVEP